MRILITFILLFTVVLNEDAVPSNQCFSEHKRKIKIASCKFVHGLTSIPQDFDTDIKELHFEDQLLNILEENNFVRYNTLTALYLKNNQIKDVYVGCLKNLTELQILDLSSNIINNLPAIFQDTPHIVEIYLNNNKITILSDDVFSNLPFLKILHLQNNNIGSIQENCFSNLPAIFEINLNTNRIEKISETIIEKLSNLKVFDLNNNPWNCDSSTCKFREYSLKRNWDISMPQCDIPENVKGKIWTDLKNKNVKIKEKETEVEEGQNVTLTCEYLACIPFNLTWRTKQDEVLANQSMQILGNKYVATLQLYTVVKSDTYVCSVEDCTDCKEEEIYLRVNDRKIETTNSNSIIIGAVITLLVVVVVVIIALKLNNLYPKWFRCCSNADLRPADTDPESNPLHEIKNSQDVVPADTDPASTLLCETKKSQDVQEQNATSDFLARPNKEDENNTTIIVT